MSYDLLISYVFCYFRSSGAATDWGKAAQEWASKRQSSPRMSPSTPRGPRTPAGSYKGTPRTPQARTPRSHRTPG